MAWVKRQDMPMLVLVMKMLRVPAEQGLVHEFHAAFFPLR